MKKKAFSLIELLISLITISVIMASLAPVITHKMKHGGISIGTKKLSMKCPDSVGSSCTLCLGNQCIACPIGCGNQFKNTLTCKCETCTQANCVNCTSDRNKCDRCKSGYQKSGNGCSACPSGQYSNEGGTCQKCPKGSKANANSAATGCTTCDGNKEYQDLDGQTTCKTCTGFVHNNYRSCTSCSAGTYWSASSSTCQSCGAGSYSSSANATSCSSCPSGQYQPNSGQTSCISCSGAVNDSKTACRSCSDFGANCIACNYYACTNTSCESKDSCTSSQYYDNCHCQPCPSGQVQSADKLTCYTPSTTPTSCKDGEYLANEKCNPCPVGCKKCSSETSCTECKNATDYKLVSGVCKPYSRPKSQEDCNRWTSNSSIYIPFDRNNTTNGGFCMTKKNAGDEGGPKIDFGGDYLKILTAGNKNSICPDETGTRCCWQGSTGKTDYCTSSTNLKNVKKLASATAWNYEGCKRTVCNWYAADYICKNWSIGNTKAGDWKLFEHNEGEAIDSAQAVDPVQSTDTNSKLKIQRYMGADGLQLCQDGYKASEANIGSPRCDGTEKCYGVTGYSSNACFPHYVWGSTTDTNRGRILYWWKGTELSHGYAGATRSLEYALSVRCVLEKFIE